MPDESLPWWAESFCRALARVGKVTQAAYAAGVSRSLVYHHRRTKPAFAADWEDALRRYRSGRARRAAYRASALAS